MLPKDKFEKARYLRQEFEEQSPYPKFCGACYFLEDWDYIAPGDKPRLCIDCAGAIVQWHKKLDSYLEDNAKRS